MYECGISKADTYVIIFFHALPSPFSPAHAFRHTLIFSVPVTRVPALCFSLCMHMSVSVSVCVRVCVHVCVHVIVVIVIVCVHVCVRVCVHVCVHVIRMIV
jgi:hypothetical protein